jgi:hypothetical protein
MAGFDAERLALVLCGPSVATGYFLTGELVLTVRHVAAGDPWAGPYEVRCEVGAEPFRGAEPIWVGRGAVDAMLLRVASSAGEWGLPSFRDTGNESGEWQSSGFAATARHDRTGDRKTQPLSGEFAPSGGQGARALALDTRQEIAAGWDTEWRGCSGAPVFTRPGGELIGLVVEGNRARSNGLLGMPVQRLLDDIEFRLAITPSFPGRLPRSPWCLVLNAEGGDGSLAGTVEGVIDGYRDEDEQFQVLHRPPVAIDVLDAVRTPENFAATVRALALADFLVADVTGFQPAVMLLLGIRAVLRRGVTVCVAHGEPNLPFNVREIRVLRYDDDGFHEKLHDAMLGGATGVRDDPLYLDLPAFFGVRTPRAEPGERTALLLCPFTPEYRTRYGALRQVIRAHTRNLVPQRMTDLRSPRLVGQTIYEDIRWIRHCLVDWTGWRPNIFFELGVRLACSPHDPFCLTQPGDDTVPAQRALLTALFAPIRYDAANPRPALREPLESWRAVRGGERWSMPGATLPAGTVFDVAERAYVWDHDDTTLRPDQINRRTVERIAGRDRERNPGAHVLFGRNVADRLDDTVRENWIASWLYLSDRVLDPDAAPTAEMREELNTVARLARQALEPSREPRHRRLHAEISAFLDSERAASDDYDRVRGLKASAKESRQARDWAAAVALLADALDILRSGLTASGITRTRTELTAELADTYGMMGGVERRWGLDSGGEQRRRHLRASVEAYDQGFSYEESLPMPDASTYNRLNRLIGRALLEPSALDDGEFLGSLREVERIVEDRLDGYQSDDLWSYCDLATVQLLRGAPGAARTLDQLTGLRPPSFVYQSLLETLSPLAQTVGARRPHLGEAVIMMTELV